MTYFDTYRKWHDKIIREDLKKGYHNSPAFILYMRKCISSAENLRDDRDNSTFFIESIVFLQRVMEVSDWFNYENVEPPIGEENFELYQKLSAETNFDKILRWQCSCVNAWHPWSVVFNRDGDRLKKVMIRMEKHIDDMAYVEIITEFENIFQEMIEIGLEVKLVSPPIFGFEDLHTASRVMNI